MSKNSFNATHLSHDVRRSVPNEEWKCSKWGCSDDDVDLIWMESDLILGDVQKWRHPGKGGREVNKNGDFHRFRLQILLFSRWQGRGEVWKWSFLNDPLHLYIKIFVFLCSVECNQLFLKFNEKKNTIDTITDHPSNSSKGVCKKIHRRTEQYSIILFQHSLP